MRLHPVSPPVSIIAGTIVGVAAFSAMSGRMWLINLIGGLILMGLLVPFVVFPLYRSLEHRSQLRIWWALLAGAAISTLPDLLITLLGMSGGVISIYAHGAQLVENGSLTAAGWYHFFVWRPSLFAPYGALGAVVAWILAFGFRLKPAALDDRVESA